MIGQNQLPLYHRSKQPSRLRTAGCTTRRRPATHWWGSNVTPRDSPSPPSARCNFSCARRVYLARLQFAPRLRRANWWSASAITPRREKKRSQRALERCRKTVADNSDRFREIPKLTRRSTRYRSPPHRPLTNACVLLCILSGTRALVLLSFLEEVILYLSRSSMRRDKRPPHAGEINARVPVIAVCQRYLLVYVFK